jgi:hypothetical protein
MTSLLIYGITAAFVKTTLLLLYFRVFRPSPEANIMIWTGIAFVVLFYLGCSVACIVLMVPQSGGIEAWMIKSMHHKVAILDLTVTQGLVGAIQDLYILAIPMYLVSGLHLARRKKLAVFALFLTGFAYVILHLWLRN